ncbi:GNAT family N-acetyltransferase [Aminobacter aganoensis]|uniref:GNAT superfamily N-acetyltransferase n=1 Tax=Aminobacter aganoensis TaxID=83264 RepID=A0A7X0F5D1_9HYPH|nr:GNAT family N-acetyltransferase [Aminobacter aganoensis]MBB6353451.1 GNAT superfamily N-acetyltransferase [Aminobacter aganoensis]
MPNDDPEEVVIRSIEPGDNLPGFVLAGKTNRPLKSFLRKEAIPYENFSLARTWVAALAGSPDLLGFITIVSGEVSVQKTAVPNDDGTRKFRYPYYPAIKVARLAVDDRHGGKKLGLALVDFALGVAKAQICPMVGCRFAIVDSKTQSIGFYEKCGFTLLDTPENRGLEHPFMYLDLHWH